MRSTDLKIRLIFTQTATVAVWARSWSVIVPAPSTRFLAHRIDDAFATTRHTRRSILFVVEIVRVPNRLPFVLRPQSILPNVFAGLLLKLTIHLCNWSRLRPPRVILLASQLFPMLAIRHRPHRKRWWCLTSHNRKRRSFPMSDQHPVEDRPWNNRLHRSRR